MKHLPGFKQALTWLLAQQSPELNNFTSQLLNLPESVWSQWLTNDVILSWQLRGNLSFLLTQITLAPWLNQSPGLDSLKAWHRYCRHDRQRYPEPSVIGARIAQGTGEDEHLDGLTEALVWFWMLEMGYPVALPYYLCHQRIILGLHLVRGHVNLDRVKQKLGCDDDTLAQILSGHGVLSLLGAFKIMELNAELALTYPPGSRQSDIVSTRAQTNTA